MMILKGKGVVGGIAIGRLFFHHRAHAAIQKYLVDNPKQELARFWEAQKRAVDQLQHLYENAVPEVGQTSAMIFHIHQMMLEDLDFTDAVIRIVEEERANAEYAVTKIARNLAEMFSSMSDPYMKERAADVRDVSERILQILMDKQTKIELPDEPVILAADDLVPSETIQLDRKKVLAFVTMSGSANSHTAILARNMDIPAIIGVGTELKQGFNGSAAIADGYSGKLFLYPTESTIRRLRKKQWSNQQKRDALKEQIGKENITQDGRTVRIMANIGNAAQVQTALQNDAGGIGLFRSEFIYMESETFPTEQQQFEIYHSVVQSMQGKKVVIRTMDIGADKQAKYFRLPPEENPALGYRAIRICLNHPEIFKPQLRALLRASVCGNLAILFPFITSVAEIREIKQRVAEVKTELAAEHIPYAPNVELGIMIETPASALISDYLAKEVDFFSIGTNDLTQYLLAIDRQNNRLDRFYDPHHLAILRMIHLVAKNAHKNGIWVGICGELAGDLSLTETFLAMGIDELSVSPSLILPLRKKLRETDVGQVQDSILAKFQWQ